MEKYKALVLSELTGLEKYSIVKIPRSENSEADALARLASGTVVASEIYIEDLPALSTEAKLVGPVVEEPSWMNDIRAYLSAGTVPERRADTHRLQARAARYYLSPRDILFRKLFGNEPYARCFRPSESEIILVEVHEGICENH